MNFQLWIEKSCQIIDSDYSFSFSANAFIFGKTRSQAFEDGAVILMVFLQTALAFLH